MRRAAKHAATGALATMALVVLAAPTWGVEPDQACNAWQVEYDVAANLTLTHTPHDAGNGTFRVGPGRVVLLIHRGSPPRVQLLGYTMREVFALKPSSVFGSAVVQADLLTQTAQGCGVAYGELRGDTLIWTSRVRDYRSDGRITCDGFLCGKFGAPPQGLSGFHLKPQDVAFGDFSFSPDGATFTMPATFVETSEDPQQTAYVSLAGRQARRVCVAPATCR